MTLKERLVNGSDEAYLGTDLTSYCEKFLAAKASLWNHITRLSEGNITELPYLVTAAAKSWGLECFNRRK